MLVTKHAAELCALLVNDVYGELPSRVLAMLFSKGRSTLAQLIHHTSLTPRQLRHGLAVLLQQNLLYHQTDPDSMATSYEANPDVCYNLVRSGKVIEMVGTEYGPAEQDVIQNLILLGHARVSDIIRSYTPQERNGEGSANGHKPEGTFSGTNSGPTKSPLSAQQVVTTLCRLVRAEIIDVVGPKTFQNPEDVYREIEQEITKTGPGEKLTAKQKAELQETVVKHLRDARDESKKLKRQLGQGTNSSNKRRKVANGTGTNDYSDLEDIDELDPTIVLRVNYEKCFVDLRNQRLVRFVSDALGEITAQVYHVLLRLLTQRLSRCRPDPRIDQDLDGSDDTSNGSGDFFRHSSVTSLEIFDQLDASVNVLAGVGKAARDKIDFRSAERIQSTPKHSMLDAAEDSDASEIGDEDSLLGDEATAEGDEVDSEDSDVVNPSLKKTRAPPISPVDARETKVKFDDGTSTKDTRFDQLRQHLLLLAESKHGFVRHCGSQGRGQWTIDFRQLMESLRQTEIDTIIEQSFGRHGLRLTRILRQNGKLDEKTLPLLALMKKPDVQGKMLAMQMAGFVDIQEVPRDNNRTANRTMFFWFFDGERIEGQLVDNFYKTMIRCLQTLEVQRHRERHILSFVDRKDVNGREQEVMTAEHYNKYSSYLELQSKLLGHVMRLDDLVAVFKDY